MARAAAGFMVIHNDTEDAVTLTGIETEAARTAELHTHIIEDDVARMRPLEGGITIPAGGVHALKRGGDHVMLMGLTQKLSQGDLVSMTFLFEGIAPLTVDIEVDNERSEYEGHTGSDHAEHDHKDHSEHKND